MAITLNEQPSIWRQDNGTDADRLAGDGAAYHSMIAHDLIRGGNNAATYVEPCAQFAFDSSYNTHSNVGRTGYMRVVSGQPASGIAFLGQLPVVVPQDAKSLCWTLGITRYGVSGPETGSLSVRVTAINMFLSPNPLNKLLTYSEYPTVALEPTHVYDLRGTIDSTCFGFSKSRTVACAATGTSAATDEYTLITDVGGWTDFNAGWVTGLGGAPTAWLVVGATFDTMLVGEKIFARDLSLWGKYE